MRDAFIITIILIALFLVAGYMYNVMAPHFAKLGIISSDFGPEAKDGGLFVSKDFGRSWNQIVDKEEDISKSSVFGLENPIACTRGLLAGEESGCSLKCRIPTLIDRTTKCGQARTEQLSKERPD